MKKSMIKYLSLIILGIVSSCDDSNVDIVAPTIEIVNLIPNPITDDICGSEDPNVFRLTGGDELSFEVIFKDNETLSQYKVDIHNNFDCHGHGGGIAPSVVIPNVNNQTTDWSVLEIKEISGSSFPESRTFNVPENVTAGNYHYQIQVLDESGNDNPAANIFSLKIKNPLDSIEPEIEMIAPVNNSFTAKRGTTINFAGTVTDDRSLSDGGNGVLYLAYTDLSSGNTFSTNKVFGFDNTIDKVYDFNFDYVVPETLILGSYRFSIGANDGVRNVADFIFFDVEVTK